MARAFRFQFLLEQANSRSEAASRVMLTHRAEWQTAEQKLLQLEQFRAEYRNRLQQGELGGISVNQWRDYQLFLAKLDAAVRQQNDAIERAKCQFEAARESWQEIQNQVNAYKKLEVRHQHQQAKKDLKIEQKTMDEYATKLFSRGPIDEHEG